LSNEKTDYDKWCDIILGDAPANNVAKFANQKELAKARESIATLVLPDTAESIIARAFMRLQAADVPRDEWHWEVCQILNSPQVGSAVETTAAPIRPYGEEVAPAGPWRVVRYGSPPDKGDMIFDEHGCIAHFGDQHHEAVGRIVYEHNVSLVNVNDKA
jgi:hypothetical protein